MKTKNEKKRKSERLAPLEWSQYRQALQTFDTRDDAAEFFGIGHVDTISNIRDKGKGNPDNIRRIREGLQRMANAASEVKGIA